MPTMIDELLSPEYQEKRRATECGYRRGFTHGIEAVRIIAESQGAAPLQVIETLSEIALRMRFAHQAHPAFLDDLLAAYRERKS